MQLHIPLIPPTLLCGVLLLATGTAAQVNESSVAGEQVAMTSSPDAALLIGSTLAALGGEGAIAAIRTTRVTGTIVVSADDNPKNITFTWEDDLSGPKPEFRDEVRNEGNLRVLVSGHGAPVLSVNGNKRKLFPHIADAATAIHLPALLLLKRSKDAGLKKIALGNEMLDQTQVEHLRIESASNAPGDSLKEQDWYIDQAAGLPLRIDYRVPSTLNALEFEKASATFSDFRKVDGVLFPFHIEVSQDGKHASSVTIDSLTTNPGLSSSSFDLQEVAH